MHLNLNLTINGRASLKKRNAKDEMLFVQSNINQSSSIGNVQQHIFNFHNRLADLCTNICISLFYSCSTLFNFPERFGPWFKKEMVKWGSTVFCNWSRQVLIVFWSINLPNLVWNCARVDTVILKCTVCDIGRWIFNSFVWYSSATYFSWVFPLPLLKQNTFHRNYSMCF